MINTLCPCKWGINIFSILISPFRTRYILQFIFHKRNVKSWCNYTHSNNSSCLYRLCLTLGPNKILGCHRHHKNLLCHSLHRTNTRRVGLRRIRGRRPHPKPIFFIPFYYPIPFNRDIRCTYYISTSNRIQQPNWD